MEITFIVVFVVICAVTLNVYLTAQRRKRLLAKYGDAAIVEKIMKRMIWEGQTEEQLIDSLGRPREVDRRVMKAKTREVWKYNQRSRTRFGLRITVEDGSVVGWDKKA